MLEPATRFLVLRQSENSQVHGFLSWQVDIEEDDAVIYWYP
jgi:hypothetical protein